MRRHSGRASGAAVARVALVLGLATGATSFAQLTEIFSDGFESGNTLAWSASVGEPALIPPDVYRMSDLDLREPHLYVSPGLGCFDFTDQDLPLTTNTAFNPQIQAAITGDAEPDGTLDASYLLQFRPLLELANDLRLDFAGGLCSAPMAGTTCAPDPASVPQTSLYDGLASGTCLEALAGTTYGPYSPEVGGVSAPCFVSAPRGVVFDLNGVSLPLSSVQIAGGWSAVPIAGFSSGLMRGFLSESDAAQVLLPASLPIVGGQPITVLLPGGAGNCSTHDDRDTVGGVSGWWFYLNFVADAVPWTGN